MTDCLTKEQRHFNMSRIKSSNTKPEIAIRKELRKQGYGYRLHVKSILGKPDIVLTKYKIAIFVNGCFWHRHEGCKYTYLPKSNIEFWQKKFECTKSRDQYVYAELTKIGWKVLIIWECEINKLEELLKECSIVKKK